MPPREPVIGRALLAILIDGRLAVYEQDRLLSFQYRFAVPFEGIVPAPARENSRHLSCQPRFFEKTAESLASFRSQFILIPSALDKQRHRLHHRNPPICPRIQCAPRLSPNFFSHGTTWSGSSQLRPILILFGHIYGLGPLGQRIYQNAGMRRDDQQGIFRGLYQQVRYGDHNVGVHAQLWLIDAYQWARIGMAKNS